LQSFKDDPVIRELAEIAPDSRVIQLNGIKQKNLTVADLVDDLTPFYSTDNSKQAVELRETKRKNTAYINALSDQKHLKI
jgi:hypothetical protein